MARIAEIHAAAVRAKVGKLILAVTQVATPALYALPSSVVLVDVVFAVAIEHTKPTCGQHDDFGGFVFGGSGIEAAGFGPWVLRDFFTRESEFANLMQHGVGDVEHFFAVLLSQGHAMGSRHAGGPVGDESAVGSKDDEVVFGIVRQKKDAALLINGHGVAILHGHLLQCLRGPTFNQSIAKVSLPENRIGGGSVADGGE